MDVHLILIVVLLAISFSVLIIIFLSNLGLAKKREQGRKEIAEMIAQEIAALIRTNNERNLLNNQEMKSSLILSLTEQNNKLTEKIIEFFSGQANLLSQQKADNLQIFNQTGEKIDEKLKELLKTNSEQNAKLNENLSEFRRQSESAYNNFRQETLKAESESNEKLFNEFNKLKEAVSIAFAEFNTTVRDLFQKFTRDSSTSLSEHTVKTTEATQKNFDLLTQNMERKLDLISGKVDERLAEGFKKTNETFINITERLVKIDEAQKKIEDLTLNVNSLQNVLTDKKSRGLFGEVQLNQILKNIFGEKNDKLYSIQYKIAENMADAVIFLPEPHGMMAIDSKFPLESYTKMYDDNISLTDREIARKEFKKNVKKHIDDISTKYIISGLTAEVAVMFLPAEAIFAEVNAYHADVLEYAVSKNVWLCSPTTVVAVLTTIQAVVRNMETGKQAKIIQEHLAKLSKEFERYYTRWNSISKHIDQVSRDVKDISVTSEKITRNFQQIQNVEFDLDSLEAPEEI